MITVSVIMITYGHEQYIEKAIKGVLSQKCDFEIELLIGDDNSPDNTEDVVLKIKKESDAKGIINYTKHSINLGMNSNYEFCYNRVQGKYIAVCEGDDYWTDPNKLQKQVNILEANPDLAISFHNVKVYNEFEKAETDFYSMLRRDKPSQITTLNTLLNGNYIPTLSVVFRNNHFNLPAEFKKFTAGDWPLHILNARYGDVYFLDEVMAVYRIHGGGVHQNGRGWTYDRKMAEIKSELLIYKTLKKMLAKEYIPTINKKIILYYKSILKFKLKRFFV